MITNETQVRLTVTLEGRLGAKASNSNTKKEKRLAEILQKKNKKFFSEYHVPKKQECVLSTTLSNDCVVYYTSEECRPTSVSSNTWKKMSQIKRLEINLQILADSLAKRNNATFTYILIK